MRRLWRLSGGILAFGAASLSLGVMAVADPAPDTALIIEHLKLGHLGAADLNGPVRGIRPGATTETKATAASIDLSIPFATGSAVPTADAQEVLASLGTALGSSTLAGNRFRIEGHADTMGQPDANRALSRRRADAVAGVLGGRYGIARSRLVAEGVGADQLIVQTPDQTAEPRNRVVRIVNLGP